MKQQFPRGQVGQNQQHANMAPENPNRHVLTLQNHPTERHQGQGPHVPHWCPSDSATNAEWLRQPHGTFPPFEIAVERCHKNNGLRFMDFEKQQPERWRQLDEYQHLYWAQAGGALPSHNILGNLLDERKRFDYTMFHLNQKQTLSPLLQLPLSVERAYSRCTD